MGNTTSAQQAAGHAKFTPSDGFFLINAARSGDLAVLRLFLDKNPALAWAVAQDKSTPWHSAAQEGHLPALTLLAEVSRQNAMSNTFNPTSKAVNQVDTHGRTPLMLACRNGHYACVQMLLDIGAAWDVLDEDGNTALHHAALSVHGGCIQLLLKKAGLWGDTGPAPPTDPQLLTYINAGDALYGRTPLHLAAWSGQLEGLNALLQAGARIMATTTADCYESSLPCNNGTTPLHLAAMKGHQDIVVALMVAYVKAAKRHTGLPDPRQALDTYGNTPHKIAASRRHDAPIMLQVLNPAAIIIELQPGARRSRRAKKPVAGGPEVAANGLPGKAPAIEAGEKPARVTQSNPSSPSKVPEPVDGVALARSVSHPVSKVDGAGANGAVLGAVGEAGAIKPEGAGPRKLEQQFEGSQNGTGSDAGESSGTGANEDVDQYSSEEDDEATTISSEVQTIGSLPATTEGAEANGGAGKDRKPITISIKKLQKLAEVYTSARNVLVHGEKGVGPTAPSQPNMQERTAPQGTGISPAVSQPAGNTTITEAVANLRHVVRGDEVPVPEYFVCPMTCRIFKEPFVAADGFSYERMAIQRHLDSQPEGAWASPCTKRKMVSRVLHPNLMLQNAVEHWKSLHPIPEDMK